LASTLIDLDAIDEVADLHDTIGDMSKSMVL
jgi:hypothetical protein